MRHRESDEISLVHWWFAAFGGIIAWLAAFLANIFLAYRACEPAILALSYGSIGVGIVIGVVAGLTARRYWQRTERADAMGGSVHARNRIAGLGGMVLNTLAVFLLVVMFATTVMLDPCIWPELWPNGA